MKTDRERAILEILLERKNIRVKDLAKQLFTSEPSIRRDLASLEKQHLIKRVYGGAVLEENGISMIKIPFTIRELEQANEKIMIAQRACSLVSDGAVLFLDASSSAYNMIPFLASKRNITVITNGLKIQMKLAEYSNIKTISTGGKLLNSCYALVGEEAYKTIDRFTADLFFFSCRGISNEGNLTDISEAEDYVRNKMLEHSVASYLLCNSNKIGTTYYHKLCHASQLNGIISDSEPPEGLKPYFI